MRQEKNITDNTKSLSNLEPIEIEGLLVGFVETSDNIYSIENPIYGSVYHWTLSEQLGEIAYANIDSSQISINWGTQDDYAILCVYEEDQFGCIGAETCIEIDLKSPNSIYDNEPILLNIYPNPFTNFTTIEYDVPTSQNVVIKIFNIKGQTIKTLVNEDKNAGYFTIVWDGTNENGDEVSSGVYFCQMYTPKNPNGGQFVKAKKMVKIR